MKLTPRPDMHDYPPAARRYWWAVVLSGAVVLAWPAWQLAHASRSELALTAGVAAIAAIVSLVPVHIPGAKASIAFADLFIVLAILLVGVPAGVLASAAEGFVGSVRSSKRWTSRILSPTQNGVSALVAGCALEWTRATAEQTTSASVALMAAVSVFGIVYYAMHVTLVNTLFALKNGKPFRPFTWWRESSLYGLWSLASSVLAAFSFLAWQQFGWATLFFTIPVIAMGVGTHRSFERAAEVSRRKSEFLAQMSHELRTPLNAILGGSQVLTEGVVGPLNERQGQWARDIHESGEHLLAVINDILDISKIEAGGMQIEREAVEVEALVARAIALVKDAAARKRIDLLCDVPPGMGVIAADERKVKQVLLNLLSNAIKFTPEGGRVGVNARREGSEVELTVSDTGVGIASEDQEVVFDAFRQVGKDGAAKAMGTGLGLTLARDLVVLHGGTLTLQSAPGQGSTFTIRLPA